MKNVVVRILVLCALITTAHAQQKLQYNLNVNDSFKVEQKASQDIIQDMNGSKHEMKNDIEADFTFVIKKVTETGFIINFTFDRFKMTTTSNLYGEIMSVDTSVEVAEDDIEAKIFSGLINANLKMTMLKNGKIEAIQGAEALVQKMIDGTGIEDDFTKELMKESMKKEFGNESLSNSFEQMTFVYPDNMVSVGDTWENSYTGDLEAQNTWTLDAMDESLISLSGTSAITMEMEEEATNMSLSGKQLTTITANTKNGFVQTMKVTSEAKGSTVMKQMNGVEVPTTITTITKYKIQ